MDLPRLYTFPSWSFDGAYIATTIGNELVIVDVVDSVVETVAEFETFWEYLDWSPTRNEIAINASLPNNLWAIYRVDVDTGAIQTIVDGIAWAPTWSPDGEWIAFVRSLPETGRQALYKVRRDGTDFQEIPTDSQCTTIGGPDWSPDFG